MSSFAGLPDVSNADSDLDDVSAQLAALSAGMGIPSGPSAPEDHVSKADVDAVIAEALAAAKASSGGKGGGKTGGKADDEDEAKPDYEAGNKALAKGLASAKAAVAVDQAGRPGAAAVKYNAALESFAAALRAGLPAHDSARANLVRNMTGYLDRLGEILAAFEPQPVPAEVAACDEVVAYTEVNKRRVDVLEALGRAGLSCMSRGVALRKKGKELEATSEWQAFLAYSEALDCFVAFTRVDAKGAQNKAVEKAMLEMLDKAEALQKAL